LTIRMTINPLSKRKLKMIYDNLEEFVDLPVVDFQSAEDWNGTKSAYRIRIGWDDAPEDFVKRLNALAAMEESDALTALVIGGWCGDDSSSSSEHVVQALVTNANRFKGLRAIFFGDIISEENEISWITQSDLSPVLSAFPNLELLRIRGGSDLELTPIEHQSLLHLGIETGGLPRAVIRQVFQCSFPNLEHLELWLGTDGYGGDATVEDLQPVLTGELFPKLKYLGIRNTDQIDDFVAVIVNSPILDRIETLDLSLGNMTDVGARALLKLSGNTSLKKLDISHHYLTEEMVAELSSKLPMEIDSQGAQGADEEWRSIFVSE
jgi:hypothetical protein